jgi:hypothetical protein
VTLLSDGYFYASTERPPNLQPGNAAADPNPDRDQVPGHRTVSPIWRTNEVVPNFWVSDRVDDGP